MRYVVVGTSGAGKTTFARELARLLGIPHVELDALHWGPDWTPPTTPEFVQAVDDATRTESWVVDGNYSAVREVLWPRAEHVVWLNFSRRVVFTRVLRRTLWRAVSRQTLWAGNRESLSRSLFTRQSILLWSFTTHRKNRVKYAGLRQGRDYAHLAWHELRSPAEARAFLRALGHNRHSTHRSRA